MSRPWYRNYQLLAAMVFIVAIAVIWFGGPYMGMPKTETRFTWIFVLMLIWVAVLMAGRFLVDRSARLFEKILRRKADEAVISASPEKRAEVALLRQRLLTAIDTLKRSRIGKTRGRAALYELPWYLVIGHPSAGKSTAILNSGLTFPLAGRGSAVAVQGVGGTRNCDWFFATEGVLLDTAGRYSTQPEDRAEWLEFLKLLKKHRGKAPVNGVIVTLSFPELVHYRSEAFVQYARSVRQRLNELENAFGMKVPVYLLFTKMDLLPGFAEFFEEMSEEDRRQAWGASLPHEQNAGFDVTRAVGQHFDVLVAGLAQMGQDLAASHRVRAGKAALHAFPIEFRGIKDAVCRFVEHLVEKDPYHTRPLVRGLYFTSALQGEQSGWALGQRVAQQYNLDRPGLSAESAPGSRSFFLQELFQGSIFPDQYLVGRQGGLRRQPGRLAGLLAGLAGLALLLGLWAWSYIGNRTLIQEAKEELVAATRLGASPDPTDRLKSLQVLQLRLEQFQLYRQQGRPTRLGWGLYRGGDVERLLRAEYFRQLRPLMLTPVKAALEDRLRNVTDPSAAAAEGLRSGLRAVPQGTSLRIVMASAQPLEAPNQQVEASYNALKAYLMLHQRERMEATLLSDQLPKYWRPWLKAQGADPARQDIQRMAERTVAFYTSQLKEPDLPTIDNDETIVASARDVLRGAIKTLSPLERMFNELKARGNTQFSPMTIGRVLENRDLDLVGGSHAVPGSFTREAWDKYFRRAIEEAARGGMKGADWVLAAPMDENLDANSADANQAKLESMYRSEYIQEWQQFLEGVAIRDFTGIDAAASAMGRLADPKTSPLKLILAKAAYETAWDNPSELNKALSGAKATVVQRAEQLLGTGGVPSGSTQLGEVGGRFAGVASLAQAPAGGRAPVDGYLDILRKLQIRLANVAGQGDGGDGARQLMQATISGSGELAEGQHYVDSVMLGGLDESSRSSVRGLLLRPLTQSFASLVPEVERDINRIWARMVLKPWSALEDKYPFANTGNDAPLADVVKFLKPGESPLDQFVDQALGSLVARRTGQVVPRAWGNQGVRFSQTFLSSLSRLMQASEAALGEGEGSRFELQPDTTIGVQEIQLELDGQRLVYRNGIQSWASFAWPGSGAQGVRLQVLSNTGASAQVLNAPGRLGLLRALDQARTDGPGGSTAVLEWRFKAARAFSTRGAKDTGEEAYPHPVRFNFRMVSGLNPLKLRALRSQSLPAKVTL